MKLLSYHYHLKIDLDKQVAAHRFTLRCIPRSDNRQRITQVERYVFPADFLSESRDNWGNLLLYGSCRNPHSSFEANVCGQAVVGLAEGVPSVHPLRDDLFRYPTALTAGDEKLSRFAASLKVNGSAVHQAEAVMEGVHRALSYVPGSTTVETTAVQALNRGCGVCQDYAHLMLAVLRCMGIPCRYVVGMLMGEGKSHAWVEVLCDGIWLAFDPTNCRRVADEHIKISHGRDYGDCVINRGLFSGLASQTTDISVIVSEIRDHA